MCKVVLCERDAYCALTLVASGMYPFTTCNADKIRTSRAKQHRHWSVFRPRSLTLRSTASGQRQGLPVQEGMEKNLQGVHHATMA